MASFFNMYEAAQRDTGKDFWFKPPAADDEGTEVIQRGLEIRADRTDGNTFWDDFIGVMGQNTEEAAKLLSVPRDKVAKWPGKIKRLLDMVRQENVDKETKKKKAHMMPTGNQ
jgi:hypothetical protein